jgi:hypothetical protein
MNEGELHSPAVLCPHCNRAMVLMRSIPAFAALLELQTYFCVTCREAETHEVTKGGTHLAPPTVSRGEVGPGPPQH